MSGGDNVQLRKIDRKWGLFIGPFGTGFSAAPALPSASPWSIMDITDSLSRAKDMGNINKLKLVGFARDGATETFETEIWGYHDDGPPEFLGILTWTLGSVTAGVDATLLPADMDKLGSEFSEARDGANWYGCDIVALSTFGVYSTGIFDLNVGIAAKMNLANVIIDLDTVGCTYLGIHMNLVTAAAAFVMYVPVE